MEWDGVKATGPVLFESTVRSTTRQVAPERFDFFPIDLILNPASRYVAFVSASRFFDGVTGRGAMQANSLNTYADGTMVFIANGTNFGMLSTLPWSTNGVIDLRFEAQFSSPDVVPTPEPASLLLVGTGAVVLARRRKTRE